MEQSITWIVGIPAWTSGTFYVDGTPITYEIAIRLELSIELALMATFVAVLISIPQALAAKQDTWIDYCVRIFSIAGLAIPSFWLGIIIILTFVIYFRWLPPLTFTSFWVDPATFSQSILPALAVGYRYLGRGDAYDALAMLEVLREDYIRTARAKGLWVGAVVIRHALKNALLPVITVIGLEFAFLVGGLVGDRTGVQIDGIGSSSSRPLASGITRWYRVWYCSLHLFLSLSIFLLI